MNRFPQVWNSTVNLKNVKNRRFYLKKPLFKQKYCGKKWQKISANSSLWQKLTI